MDWRVSAAAGKSPPVNWSQVVQRQPILGELGSRRLLEPGVVLVVTIRRDGSARLSPVEPFVLDDDLYLSMMWGSRKAADLSRDPRILVHSIITSRDGNEGEFKVRGQGCAVVDFDIQRRYANAVGDALGWRPEPGRFHLFSIDVEHLAYIQYDGDTGDQHVAMWPPEREFVRRSTSATSVGSAEPVRRFLVDS